MVLCCIRRKREGKSKRKKNFASILWSAMTMTICWFQEFGTLNARHCILWKDLFFFTFHTLQDCMDTHLPSSSYKSIYLSIYPFTLLYFTFSRANSVLSSMDVVGSVHFQLSFTNLHEIYIYIICI